MGKRRIAVVAGCGVRGDEIGGAGGRQVADQGIAGGLNVVAQGLDVAAGEGGGDQAAQAGVVGAVEVEQVRVQRRGQAKALIPAAGSALVQREVRIGQQPFDILVVADDPDVRSVGQRRAVHAVGLAEKSLGYGVAVSGQDGNQGARDVGVLDGHGVSPLRDAAGHFTAEPADRPARWPARRAFGRHRRSCCTGGTRREGRLRGSRP